MPSRNFIPSLLVFAVTLNASAQQQPVLASAKPVSRAPSRPAQSDAAGASQLPVTRVALYKNGVGFFEHSGRVTGDQSVSIDFTTSQLNDVLQSLTAVDLNGGRIAGAGYNSTTPLEQQLRALPLALGQDPTPMEFYNSIRGARVEVHGPGGTITGRLFNIEVKRAPSKDGQPGAEVRVITVIGDEGGVRTAELTPTTEVKLLDAGLHQDLTRYLQLLANNRNQGLRHLTLQDNGAGARELRVSYISEVPIWKSTYRILFTEPSKDAKATPTATLQGWSVVDNTTGADWVNVRLSLIAGAPQSFIQPLSIPYYSRRPQIGMQMEAQTTPQLHQSGEMQGDGAINGRITDINGAAIRNAKVTATDTSTGVQTARQTNASGAYDVSPLPPGNYKVEVTAPGFRRLLQENVPVNAGRMMGLNLKLSVGTVTDTVTVTAAPPMLETMNATLGGTIQNQMFSNQPISRSGGYAASAATADSLSQGVYGGSGRSTLTENYISGIPIANYEQAASGSLGGGASASAFDHYFEYKIGEPVTIRKNESAMVPILQTKIDAERVTLWSAQQPAPLRALWVTNTSNLTLDRGSFSIVEDGNFGGEGLLDPIHPAEKRLLSYAVDQAVRVTTEGSNFGNRVTTITAAKGVLILHNRETREVTYVVRNAASEARTVVIEHPVQQAYSLDSEETATAGKTDSRSNSKPDPKPDETTPTLYRYKVQAAAGETVRLHIGEHRSGNVTYRLALSDDNELNLILNQSNHSAATEKAIQPILEARRHVAEMQDAVAAANSHMTALRDDEERQRSNINALASADKSSRERFVHDLNATEDQIAAARREIATAEVNLQTAKDELANKIGALQIDEQI